MKECASLLQKLIQYPTITPKECGIYELIQSYLNDFEFIHISDHGVQNLFAYKKGALDKHFCFMGHIDVVPPGEGWSVEAFSGLIQDGYIYGRGAQDMKSGVSAFVCALKDFLAQSKAQSLPLPTLSILLTSDEEGAGIYGTRIVLERLSELCFLPDMALVAEPTCVQNLGDMIKIGRRGSINGVLKILGKQGHVAYPQKCINPTEALGGVLGEIAGVKLDSGDENFAPSKIVITDMRGGMEVVNVTPNELKIMFNIRNSPNTTLENVEHYFAGVIDKIKRNEPKIVCELTLNQSSKPFLTQRQSPLIQALSQSIQNICGTMPTLSTSGGTSDARFCAGYNIAVAEFGVCNDRIHSIDERVKIKEVEGLYEVFMELLRQLSAKYR